MYHEKYRQDEAQNLSEKSLSTAQEIEIIDRKLQSVLAKILIFKLQNSNNDKLNSLIKIVSDRIEETKSNSSSLLSKLKTAELIRINNENNDTMSEEVIDRLIEIYETIYNQLSTLKTKMQDILDYILTSVTNISEKE
jgi:hypothetical protein